ncbi:MAG: pilin [Chloroflexi bacterium]|nr:pilin [Chloroflexota bacterium]
MKLGFKRGQNGFTLVELMVVLAILAVLAGIAIPSVTGVTTISRQTTQPMDINEVQTAADRFNADHSDGSPAWPTKASLALVTTAWSAGSLPTADPTGSGTSTDVYVFTQNATAGIDWSSNTTVSGVTKVFYSDYLRSKPRYADTTITVNAGATSDNFTIRKGNSDVYIQLKNTTSGNLTFSVWGVDRDGAVWVFKNAVDY